MKKQLLMKMLLAVALLGVGGNSVWAETQTVYSWNFTSYGTTVWLAVNNEASPITLLNKSTYPCSVSKFSGLYLEASGSNTDSSIRMDKNGGIRAYTSGGNVIGIPGLKAGDLVTIIGSRNGSTESYPDDLILEVSDNAGLTKDDLDNYTVTMSSAGDLGIKIVYYNKVSNAYYTIKSIVVTRDVPCQNPTYTITGTSGTSRKFTLDCETEDATIYYSESERVAGAEGWTTYSSEVTTASGTIWAYASKSGSNSDVISFSTGAGSAIKLNAPTVSSTAYSAGNYTVQITSSQTGLSVVPASVSIKYSIDGGNEQTYSAPFSVAAGKTVTAYVYNADYANSDATSLTVAYKPSFSLDWEQNFAGVVESNVAMSKDASTYYNCLESNISGYYVPTSDGTTALTNKNIGFQISYSSSSSRKWTLSTTNMYNAGSGTGTMVVGGLEAGQIVEVSWYNNASYASFSYNSSNLTKIDEISYGTVGFFRVKADGQAEFYVGRAGGVYYVKVYDDTTIGAFDYSTINRGETHDLATLSDGDVYKVTFQNHGSNGAYKNNFVAYIKNSSSTIVAGMYADWYDWVADPTGSSASSAVTFTSPYATSMDGGLTLPASCWTNYYTDMADCPVDLTFSYSGGTLRIAGTATKDDHIYYYNYAYSGLEGDVTVGLSVCAAWLEVLSTASSASVSGTIASSGYSTIAVPYALDLSSATGIDAAYVVTKTTTEEVTLTSIATAVPAGTPLILKGTGSAAYSIPVVATGTAPETNYLSAAIVPTGIAANAAYILQSGEFHKVTEASTVPASKAYLLGTNVPSGARALTFTFGDEASGVEEIENGKLNIENGIYDLQGRRVNSQFFDEQSGRAERTSHNSQLNKGLYIVNGKKVIK